MAREKVELGGGAARPGMRNVQVAIADVALALLVDLAQALCPLVKVAALLGTSGVVGLKLVEAVALLLWGSLVESLETVSDIGSKDKKKN